MPQILNCPKCSAPMSLGPDFEGESFDCVECNAPLKMRGGRIVAAAAKAAPRKRRSDAEFQAKAGNLVKGVIGVIVACAACFATFMIFKNTKKEQAEIESRESAQQQLDDTMNRLRADQERMMDDLRRSTNLTPSPIGVPQTVPEEPPRPTAERFPIGDVNISIPQKLDLAQFRAVKQDGYTIYAFAIGNVAPDYTGPGDQTQMHLYIPDGEWASKTLPCVLVPPAGTALMHGSGIGDPESHPEHVPYLSLPAAVITFSLDGDFDVDNGLVIQLIPAYKKFCEAMAGVVNAKIAFECARNLEIIDPLKIFIAGHSSAGTLSLLFGAHEPLLAGVLSYAPEVDLIDHYAEISRQMNTSVLPQFQQFGVQSSPLTHVEFLSCPTFIYHSSGDRVTSPHDSREFARQLAKSNGNTKYVSAPGFDHYQTMIDDGLPQGLAWLKSLIGEVRTFAGPRTRFTYEVRRFLVGEQQVRKQVETTLKSIQGVVAESIELDFEGSKLSFVVTGGDATRLEAARQLAATGKLILNPQPIASETVE